MSRLGRGLVGSLVVACTLGCGDDGGDGGPANGTGPGGGEQVTFAADIHPILVRKCGTAGCHDTPEFLPGHGAADVDEAYEAVTGQSYAGGPVYERILVRVASTDPFSIMPPTSAGCEGALGEPGCVTQAEYDLIQAWVNQGRPR